MSAFNQYGLQSQGEEGYRRALEGRRMAGVMTRQGRLGSAAKGQLNTPSIPGRLMRPFALP